MSAIAASPTLGSDALMDERRRAGLPVLALGSGEVALPVPPGALRMLGEAAEEGAYPPPAGTRELRAAAAGYWSRRGLPTDSDSVVIGPGSKALLLALVAAIPGDVVVSSPSWVSYEPQARLLGREAIRVPVARGRGGIPDPGLLMNAVHVAREAGRRPGSVIVTIPDNPTGTVPTEREVGVLAAVARELDLIVISDEVYSDLVYRSPSRISPAHHAPERTVIVSGLSKNYALAGWRLGLARFPDLPVGNQLKERMIATVGHFWSGVSTPVQHAASYVLSEPAEISAYLRSARRLHARISRHVAAIFRDAGAIVHCPEGTIYVYPDFEPHRDRLRHLGIENADDLAASLLARFGIGTISGSAFGEPDGALRIRVAICRLYGKSAEQQREALDASRPENLPWVRAGLTYLQTSLSDLLIDSTRTDRQGTTQ